jgi:hypothetical protein
METYERMFVYGNYIIYILYAFSIFGVWSQAPDYLNTVKYFFQIFIGLLLVLFNNPLYRKHKFRPIDRKIAFSAGIFLLTTTTINIFISNIRKLSNNFEKIHSINL